MGNHYYTGRSLFVRCGGLFSDAEGGEDQAEDVVGGGGAGDLVQWAERVVEIEQQHFVNRHALHRS